MARLDVYDPNGFDFGGWGQGLVSIVNLTSSPTIEFDPVNDPVHLIMGVGLNGYSFDFAASVAEPFTGTDFLDVTGTITTIYLYGGVFDPGLKAVITDFNATIEDLRLALATSISQSSSTAIASYFFDREFLFHGNNGGDVWTGGNAANTFIGYAGTDYLAGGISFDILSGGSGSTDETFIDDGAADTMTGGDDSDTYYVGTDDVVTENAGEGDRDEMRSYLDTTIASNVEILRLIGTSDISGYGSTARNILHGNSGHNQLFGYAGIDDLFGGDGDDRLAGGADGDSMTGGQGNDTYEVDNALDQVVEADGQGTDLIISTIAYTLAAHTEILWLTGSANIGGKGRNDAVNGDTISGNSGNNILEGFAGADKLSGNIGDDTLDGGIGADTMEGGAGNDIYDVDNSGDVVTETISGVTGGSDWVFSSISYTLGANLEELYLEDASTAIQAFGNTIDNRLVGNKFANDIRGLGGADHLDGLGGADSMYGGDGNDTYVVDHTSDKVSENNAILAVGGNDTVQSKINYTLGSNVENLLLLFSTANGTGNAAANTITGNAANNVLYGLGGFDTIKGMAGADWIVGGSGADDLYAGIDTVKDTFKFLSYGDSATNAANLNAIDWIIEFKRGNDKIDLSTLDANLGRVGNQAFVLDSNGDFKAGEIKLVRTGAHTVVLLNADADASSEFALLVRNVSGLSSSDFVL